MRTVKCFALFCIMCLLCQPIFAQCRVRLADLPPFERAVVVVKYFEGMHGWKDYPYVGYGHQLQAGEHFTADMTERQADSCFVSTYGNALNTSKGMGRMRCYWPCLPTMWAWDDCSVTANIPRADYYERLRLVIGISIGSMFRSAYTRVRSWKVW